MDRQHLLFIILGMLIVDLKAGRPNQSSPLLYLEHQARYLLSFNVLVIALNEVVLILYLHHLATDLHKGLKPNSTWMHRLERTERDLAIFSTYKSWTKQTSNKIKSKGFYPLTQSCLHPSSPEMPILGIGVQLKHVASQHPKLLFLYLWSPAWEPP